MDFTSLLLSILQIIFGNLLDCPAHGPASCVMQSCSALLLLGNSAILSLIPWICFNQWSSFCVPSLDNPTYWSKAKEWGEWYYLAEIAKSKASSPWATDEETDACCFPLCALHVKAGLLSQIKKNTLEANHSYSKRNTKRLSSLTVVSWSRTIKNLFIRLKYYSKVGR